MRACVISRLADSNLSAPQAIINSSIFVNNPTCRMGPAVFLRSKKRLIPPAAVMPRGYLSLIVSRSQNRGLLRLLGCLLPCRSCFWNYSIRYRNPRRSWYRCARSVDLAANGGAGRSSWRRPYCGVHRSRAILLRRHIQFALKYGRQVCGRRKARGISDMLDRQVCLTQHTLCPR